MEVLIVIALFALYVMIDFFSFKTRKNVTVVVTEVASSEAMPKIEAPVDPRVDRWKFQDGQVVCVADDVSIEPFPVPKGLDGKLLARIASDVYEYRDDVVRIHLLAGNVIVDLVNRELNIEYGAGRISTASIPVPSRDTGLMVISYLTAIKGGQSIASESVLYG